MPAHTRKQRSCALGGIHRRSIILLLAIIACVIVSNVYIRSVGTTYVYRLEEFAGTQLTEDNFQITPEGMAEISSLTTDGDVQVVEFRGLSEGEGMMMVGDENGGMMVQLAVKPGNVVVFDGANFTGWRVIGWSVVVCFAVALALCVWNLVTLLRRAWYGYEMAAYAGLSLFCAYQTVVFLQAMLSGSAREFSDLVVLVVRLADGFVWVTLPIVAIGAALVAASNVILMRREGRGFTNMLGVALGLAVAVACVVWRVVVGIEYGTYESYIMSFGINSVVASAIAFGFSLLIGSSLCAWAAAHHTPSMPRDFLIVLGCGLRPDGSPTPLLAGRVDAALDYARKQQEAGHDAPTFVPSGGKGDDERWAEAESMRRYLAENGVDEALIIPEDKSTSTRENFRFSAEKIAEAWEDRPENPRVAFSTTNYHVFRSYVFAHEAGLDAEGIAAPTKLYFWPNAFLREFVGLLAARRVPLLLMFLLISALYVLAEYIMLLG